MASLGIASYQIVKEVIQPKTYRTEHGDTKNIYQGMLTGWIGWIGWIGKSRKGKFFYRQDDIGNCLVATITTTTTTAGGVGGVSLWYFAVCCLAELFSDT